MSELRRNLKINGETYHLAVNQYGSGVPTATTPGKPGVIYMNTADGTLYKCISAKEGQSVWELAFSGKAVSPVAKTSNMTQKVGIDNNGMLWTEGNAGRLFYANVATGGEETFNIPHANVQLPIGVSNVTLGDKFITADGYLYELTGITGGSINYYPASLVCALGGDTYDCVIGIDDNRPPNAGENVTYSVVSGSLLAVLEKVNSGNKPNILLQYIGEHDGDTFNNFSEAVHVEHYGNWDGSPAGLYMDFIMGGELVQLSSDSNADITNNIITRHIVTSLTGGGEEYDLIVNVSLDNLDAEASVNVDSNEFDSTFAKIKNGETVKISVRGIFPIHSGDPVPVNFTPVFVAADGEIGDYYEMTILVIWVNVSGVVKKYKIAIWKNYEGNLATSFGEAGN